MKSTQKIADNQQKISEAISGLVVNDKQHSQMEYSIIQSMKEKENIEDKDDNKKGMEYQ